MQISCTLFIAAAASQASAARDALGDPARGKSDIKHFGCIACHMIPGIPGPSSNVGPPLDKIGKRAYIAGVLANTPANMQRWLRNPPAVKPGTAMPNLDVNEIQARDIAAYLTTLD